MSEKLEPQKPESLFDEAQQLDDFEDEEVIKRRHAGRVRKENRKMKKKVARAKRIRGHIIRIIAAIVILFGLREFVSYTNIPVIASWRDLYIETAMTTHSHQWLATWIFPKSVIERVMAELQRQDEMQSTLESSWDEVDDWDDEVLGENATETEFFETYWELNSDSFRAYLEANPSLLKDGYSKIKIKDLEGNLDLMTTEGDRLLAVDIANNIMIIGVKGDGYVGKMAIIKNPAQVEHVRSRSFGTRGQEIQDFAESNGAVLAIKASAFDDPDGHGSGGTIQGSCVCDGVEYGYPIESQKWYGMKMDNHFYVTAYQAWATVNYRWAVQFYPAMIIDGENVLASNSGGMGIQPRSCIGQARDGTFMMLVVDGRQVGYSLGTTVAECASILERYGAYQAGNLDGGSSSVMIYEGEQITRSSSATGRGRYCPDCLLVMPADQ